MHVDGCVYCELSQLSIHKKQLVITLLTSLLPPKKKTKKKRRKPPRAHCFDYIAFVMFLGYVLKNLVVFCKRKNSWICVLMDCEHIFRCLALFFKKVANDGVVVNLLFGKVYSFM